MDFKACVCCAVLATLAVEDAAAADLGGKRKRSTPPPPAPQAVDYVPASQPAPIWQGLYWGLSAGYGWGESEQTYNRNDNHGLASTAPHGALASVTVGYNYMWSHNVLVGIEGDLGLMDISADDKIVYDGHVYKTSFGPWWGTVRGRAGYLWDSRTLFYGTAGIAFMAVDEVSIGNTPGETASNRDVRSGWVVGAGIEHAFLPGVTGKIEYLHMDFGSYDGFSANREDFSFANRIDLVRAGLNFKY